MVPGVPCVNRGNWGRECDENVLYSRSSWTTYFTECCILRGPLGKDSCVIRSSHTQNDVERFWNEPVHELYSLKASRMCKVRTSSHEIKNKPYVRSNCENTGRTVTADFTTNYDAETNTSLTEKIKNVREHNFESGANNSELDEDTDRSDLNSKVKYLSSALPLNILFLLLVFIGLNACKVRLVFRT